MGAWEMHHRSTKTRPTKPCWRRMIDPHLIAWGVCEKESKSELNLRAAGKEVWHLSPCLENGSRCCCASGLSRFASSIGELRRCAGRSMHSSLASDGKRVFRPPVSSSLPEW